MKNIEYELSNEKHIRNSNAQFFHWHIGNRIRMLPNGFLFRIFFYNLKVINLKI